MLKSFTRAGTPIILLMSLTAGYPILVADAATRVIVIGDSLTEGLGVQPDEAYPALLQQKFRASGKDVTIVNMGTSGATSASAPSRVKFALSREPLPDVVVLALGANDGLRGLNPAAMKQRLAEAIDLAQAKGIRVFMVGMKMPFNFPKETRAAFERVFPELAKEKKTGFLPFLLEGVAADPKLNQSDQIHPNPEGHRKIAGHVYPDLARFIERTTSNDRPGSRSESAVGRAKKAEPGMEKK